MAVLLHLESFLLFHTSGKPNSIPTEKKKGLIVYFKVITFGYNG
ncbi:hypothetical protein BACCOP_01034 [Phocaeicola coprocola DSM 17136]|uniref:Uncharacterized protein n=1 Tax=Phocaeicola coprocola DSM 17136 TaxID=470145 RepID=B3JGM9_9BACT|nr:hypothetical protein BACCOP_01034 [Phocaeicola coprocola DSM 17136]